MNRWLEFHDSDIGGVTNDGADLILHFRPTYVHESAGRAGTDAGIGSVQDVSAIFVDGSILGAMPVLPAEILDGEIQLGEVTHDNGFPFPHSHQGRTELRLTFGTGEKVVIIASGCVWKEAGPARIIEEFPGQNPK